MRAKARRQIRQVYGLIWPLVFLLSGSFSMGEDLVEGREAVASANFEVEDGHLDRSTPREPTGLMLERGEWKYNCMECHRSLGAKWHLELPLMEHRELELKHGNNRFCLNCHHPKNRDAFVDYDGSEIAPSEVILLCAKCHGPQHRDWVIGAHGRRNGYWDLERGEGERLSCIQCHDPHDPKFKAMEPLAAPSYPARAAGQRAAKKKMDEKHEVTDGE